MERIKYPRTPHFPWSPGATSDDRMLKDDSQFTGKKVVVTVKMDGENTSVYQDGTVHARSLNSARREYHSWLMGNVQGWCRSLPEGLRVCGEYLWAKHSIAYDNLPSYFLAFSVWNSEGCLGWDETKELLDGLGVQTVPVLYEGEYDADVIKSLAEKAVQDGQEGIVVRTVDGFNYNEFGNHVAKYVREGHVQTEQHWSLKKIEKNALVAQ